MGSACNIGQFPRKFCSSCLHAYVFSAPARLAAGARDLSRRNVSTVQTRPQNSKASFAHPHSCGLKSAPLRSRGDNAKHLRNAGLRPGALRKPTGFAPDRRSALLRDPCAEEAGPGRACIGFDKFKQTAGTGAHRPQRLPRGEIRRAFDDILPVGKPAELEPHPAIGQ